MSPIATPIRGSPPSVEKTPNGRFWIGKSGWPVALAIPAAALMTALLGTLLVFPAFRLRGHYMAIATLGVAIATRR